MEEFLNILKILIWEENIIKEVILQKKEVNLLLGSTCCDENIELGHILQEFNKGIKSKQLEVIEKKNESVYKIIKTPEARVTLIDSMAKEWVQKAPCGKDKSPCELCGNTKSEEKFIIENRINKKILKVGSSCIFKFPTMSKKYMGESILNISKYSKKSPEILARIVIFNEHYDGGKDIINKWIKKFSEFNIVFPVEYDSELRVLNSRANKFYKDFKVGTIGVSEVQKFQYILFDYEHLYKKYSQYSDLNSSDRYVCTIEIGKALQKLGMEVTLNDIKSNNSKIKRAFSKYIYEESFISRFKDEIKELFSRIDSKLIEIKDGEILLQFKYKTYEPLKFFIGNEIFSSKFHNVYYGDYNFKKDEIYNEIRIKKDYDNIKIFISILDKLLGNDYYIRLDDYLYNMGRCDIVKKNTKEYVEISMDSLIKNYSKVVYLSNYDAKEFVLELINKNNKWNSSEDKDKFNIGNIAEVWSK